MVETAPRARASGCARVAAGCGSVRLFAFGVLPSSISTNETLAPGKVQHVTTVTWIELWFICSFTYTIEAACLNQKPTKCVP